MLKLKGITKDYKLDTMVVRALRGVSLEFKENEFVSILGPSGCGKTTLLNIIGGLDHYTYGELLIDGKSTVNFKDSEWDAYRNSTIGFIFQSYNLISHLSVLDNVAIALTLSGVGMDERKKRATEALERVGLHDQLDKKPNQLSGGQMQRVAIARALVNNPKILLADEPTGALDSVTSEQIMELIKDISKDRLVIMVTHNQELAEQCSDRIIKLLDGVVLEDSRPYEEKMDEGGKLSTTKTAMSFSTALKLSFKNLMTKKWRTVITAFAGSIGIIGIALILAISSGMSGFINDMQRDALAGMPLSISRYSIDLVQLNNNTGNQVQLEEFPNEEIVHSYKPLTMAELAHENTLTKEYLDYLNGLDKELYNDISYLYDYSPIVIAKTDSGNFKQVQASSSTDSLSALMGGGSAPFMEMPASKEFVESQYSLLGANSKYPYEANEVALVLDSRNRLSNTLLEELGIAIKDEYSFDDFLGREFKAVKNNDYYKELDGMFMTSTPADYEALYNSENSVTLKIVGILRIRDDVEVVSEVLSTGVVYSPKLTSQLIEDAMDSDIVKAQIEAGEEQSVLMGVPFTEQVTYKLLLQALGGDDMPTGINIYPKDFESKDKIKVFLDAFNEGKETKDKIMYTDAAEMITGMISSIINTITVVLTAFAAISLVVSSIMIAIITYVSVVERTKEIGILRAIGARKKDISRVFNAETVIIGFTAGIMGVLISLMLSIPINIIIMAAVGVSNIASLPILSAVILIGISVVLTLISGFIPSKIAAKKDPVVALRTE